MTEECARMMEDDDCCVYWSEECFPAVILRGLFGLLSWSFWQLPPARRCSDAHGGRPSLPRSPSLPPLSLPCIWRENRCGRFFVSLRGRRGGRPRVLGRSVSPEEASETWLSDFFLAAGDGGTREEWGRVLMHFNWNYTEPFCTPEIRNEVIPAPAHWSWWINLLGLYKLTFGTGGYMQSSVFTPVTSENIKWMYCSVRCIGI